MSRLNMSPFRLALGLLALSVSPLVAQAGQGP